MVLDMHVKTGSLRTHFTYVMHISKEPSPQKRVKLEQRNGCENDLLKNEANGIIYPTHFHVIFMAPPTVHRYFTTSLHTLGLLTYAFHECIKIAVCLH